jgi:hypothetical protein
MVSREITGARHVLGGDTADWVNAGVLTTPEGGHPQQGRDTPEMGADLISLTSTGDRGM